VSRKLTAGDSLAQYKIVKLLGEGGMGAVYEAHDESLDRNVAIKTLLSDVAQDPESRKRFFREGKAAAKLRHPHVVEVYGVGIEGEVPYLVMELLDGESLAQLVEREKTLAAERTVDILLPVLSALVTAHEEGVIHRDLKPDNIFLQRTRAKTVVPKLLDFGISKVTSAHNSRLTHTSALMGTPYYMSPEQARGGKDVSPAVDQWAMGVILYETLSGVRPITGETVLEILHRIATMPLVPLEVVAPTVPPELAKVVMRALDREPAARHATVRALGQALLPFASEGSRTVWTPAFARSGTSERPPPPAPSHHSDAVTVAVAPRPRPDGGDATVSAEMTAPPAPVSITGSSLGRRTGSGLTRNLEPAASDRGAVTGPIAGEPVALPGSSNNGLLAIAVLAVAVAVVGILVAFGAGGEPRTTAAGASTPGPTTPGSSTGVPAPTSLPEPPPTVQPPPTTPRPAPLATFEAALSTTPPSSRIELDGELVGSGTWTTTLPRDGRPHRLRVSADGFETTELVFTDSPPPSTVTLSRTSVAGRGPRGTGSRDLGIDMAGSSGPSTSGMAQPAVGANGAPILE